MSAKFSGMAEFAPPLDEQLPARPDTSHLVTEDDEPVDNWFQERQQRLLATSLYSSWAPGRDFLAAADVGLFFKISEPAVVPDVMVSLDVSIPTDYWESHNRSYMVWEFGKPPELVVEVVSNREGAELEKLGRYARIGVSYSVIYDPQLLLGKRALRVFMHHAGQTLDVVDASWLEPLGIGVKLWEGSFEGISARWLRWCDREGRVLLTGDEKLALESERADREAERARRLAERLRELGIEPEE